jgi:tRNA pseudouridine38-40 synthase
MEVADAPARMLELLHSRDRRQAGMTAPAAGLYFWEAQYPQAYGIPATLAPMPFLGL